MSDRTIILLATQRSGTNFLRGVLAGHPRLDCYSEVFLDPEQGGDHAPAYHHGVVPFWDFFRARIAQDCLLGMPSRRAELVGDYFGRIDAAAESTDRTALVDVKYNSLHHMDGFWRGPTSPPEMLKFFGKREYPIVHLIRRNPVRVAVSLFHAMETRQYVGSGDQQISSEVIHPDPVRFANLLGLQMRNLRMVRGWLRRCPKVKEVYYEDFLAPEEPSGLNRQAFLELQKFLGLHEPMELEARTKRTTARELRDVLGNFDAIQKRLAGTEFECYLDEREITDSAESHTSSDV